MEEQGAEARWITVQELRDRFSLTRYQCNTVSGFLRRLHAGAFGRFPYIVIRIDQADSAHPWDPPKCRYLVKRKEPAAVQGMMQPAAALIRLEADSGESG